MINPVSILHRGLIYGFGFGWIIILAVFLFDLFSSKRGWCSHLCPMGALYSVIGKFSPIRVRGDKRAQCDQCNECYLICPEPQVLVPVLREADKGIGPVIEAGACTNCGRCIDICAEDVFKFGFRYASAKSAITLNKPNAQKA
jgi:ferredoxin-type protein NapH